MDKAPLLTAYEDAILALPPLARAVFLMHRVDDLTYREIAARLAADIAIVEDCMIYALTSVARTVDCQALPVSIAAAEAAVLRYNSPPSVLRSRRARP